MIYMIRTISNPEFVKIGYTKNRPYFRLKSLQTGCPHKLEMVRMLKGSFIHEGIFHGHLKEFSAQGEWFLYSEECKERIEAIIKEFNLVAGIQYRQDPKPRKSHVDKQLTERIMFFINRGDTIREVSEKLKIHKDTVIRHKNTYRFRKPTHSTS